VNAIVIVAVFVIGWHVFHRHYRGKGK